MYEEDLKEIHTWTLKTQIAEDINSTLNYGAVGCNPSQGSKPGAVKALMLPAEPKIHK